MAAPLISEVSALEKIKKIEDELRCSICQDYFMRAFTLNCSHSFCCNCIQTWWKKHSECPLCREFISGMTPSRSLDNMVTTVNNGVRLNSEALSEENTSDDFCILNPHRPINRGFNYLNHEPFDEDEDDISEPYLIIPPSTTINDFVEDIDVGGEDIDAGNEGIDNWFSETDYEEEYNQQSDIELVEGEYDQQSDVGSEEQYNQQSDIESDEQYNQQSDIECEDQDYQHSDIENDEEIASLDTIYDSQESYQLDARNDFLEQIDDEPDEPYISDASDYPWSSDDN